MLLFFLLAVVFGSSAADHHTQCDADNVRTRAAFDGCLATVKNDLNENFPFLAFPTALKAIVNAKWTNPELNFTFCSCEISYPADSIESKPLGEGLVAVEAHRLIDSPSLQFDYFDDATPQSGLYTLAMIDPYAGSNRTTPFNHFLVINFNGTDLTTGYTSVDYTSPLPRPPQCIGAHFYIFLYFEQQGRIDPASLSAYAGPIPTTPNYQYKFGSFVKDANLTLIGATWQNAHFDLWVGMQYDIQNLAVLECGKLQNCRYNVPPVCTTTSIPTTMNAATPTQATQEIVSATPTSGARCLSVFAFVNFVVLFLGLLL